MATKIQQLRKELSKLAASNYDVLNSNCKIFYSLREREYKVLAGEKVIGSYSFDTLMRRIEEKIRIEQTIF